jgi:hypothetical protein
MLLCVLVASLLAAQPETPKPVRASMQAPIPPPQNPVGRPIRGVPRNGHPRPEPCWEQAGISKSALQERKVIQEHMRSEIAAVCADSSLNQRQRHERIRAIHEQARQQIDALISPQQREALKACQEARGHGGGFHGGGGGHGGGPCGEMPNPEPIEEPQPKQ